MEEGRSVYYNVIIITITIIAFEGRIGGVEQRRASP